MAWTRLIGATWVTGCAIVCIVLFLLFGWLRNHSTLPQTNNVVRAS
jgi:hypothetical protein